MQQDYNEKVLIVDNDENVSEVVDMYLKSSGYDTKIVKDGRRAQLLYQDYAPDITLIDIIIPSFDGISLLKWIRKMDKKPIIIITSKDDVLEKVLALEIGADDYIVKPFDPKELIARIKAVMRRYKQNDSFEDIINLGDLVIDSNSYKVIYKSNEIKMPPKEFELLYYLARRANKVFTRDELLCEVWGYDYPGDSRTVDVHVKRLREKLCSGDEWQIKTVWGIGYKFELL